MSGSGSNQLEPMALAIMLPTIEKSTEGKRGKAKLVQDKKKAPTPQDSPSLCRIRVCHVRPGCEPMFNLDKSVFVKLGYFYL